MIKLSTFAGVRNDVSPERFSDKDLSVGTNIELDETGKPYRRLGTTVLNATPTHSLWADEEICLCVRNGTLQRVMPDMTFVDYLVMITGPRVSYKRVGNDVYWSDGIITGIINVGTGYRPWGITPPTSTASTTITGELRAGRYLFTTTFVRTTGLESGAPPVSSIVVGVNQGISIILPVSSDPLVDSVRLYMSDCDGEVPYLIGVYPVGVSIADVTVLPDSRTLAVTTLRKSPPPAGVLIGYYKGRIYVADNEYLWYTQPYEYELLDRSMNFIGFSAPVKTFAPVSDGIFVGTDDQTVFLSGDEPEKFSVVPMAPYGTVLGTEEFIPGYYFSDPAGANQRPKVIPLWMSKHGMCAGMDGGQFMNLTGGRYVLPEGVAKGASLLKIRGASPQLVTTLFS